jgi:small-conductance mechanosensitive channel
VEIVFNFVLFAVLFFLGMMLPRWLQKLNRHVHWLKESYAKAVIPLQILGVAFLWTAGLKFSSFDSEAIQLVRPLFGSLFIIGFAWLAKALVVVPRNLYLKKVSLESSNNLEARKVVTQFVVLERVVVFAVMILAICLILMNFESMRRLGMSLLASAGVLGIVAGFAAQKSIANVFAGIQIAITQPIRIDDVVIMEGEWGWIEEINLTYVVVRIWDQRRLIVPISQCIEKSFQNWTRTSADILGSVTLMVDYAFPVDEIRKETTRLLGECEHWDGRVNVVHVVNLTDKAMEIRVLVSSKNSPSSWELRCFIREKLMLFCQRNYPEYLPRFRLEPWERLTEN